MGDTNYSTMEWREDLRPFDGIRPDDGFGRGTTLPYNPFEHGHGEATTLPYIVFKNFKPAAESIEHGYIITDDGRLVPATSVNGGEFVQDGAIPSDEDFRRYIEATNDWGIYGGTQGEKPSYDEWKKSQPGYDPDKDDNSMQLPDEVMEAIKQAAEEAGLEQPWSFTITAENCPELFEKIDELYKQANPEFKPLDLKGPDNGFIGYMRPDQLPEDILEKFKQDIPGFGELPDPSASPYYPPISIGDHGLTPEQIEEIIGGMEPVQLIEPVANQPSDDSPFYGILNDKISAIDLDAAFEGVSAPSLSGSVFEEPVFRAELLGEQFMPPAVSGGTLSLDGQEAPPADDYEFC